MVSRAFGRGKQKAYEDEHMAAVMRMLKFWHIREHKVKILAAKGEIARLEREEEHNAENYCKVTELLKEIGEHKNAIDSYRCFFDEPYFARMDLTDPLEGYNSYYIGKKGDVKLEIVDWRAPLARRYYQKSRISFSINEYDYKTVLRRALRTKDGQVLDFKNEFLSVREYLTDEEIGDGTRKFFSIPIFGKSSKTARKNPRSRTSSKRSRKSSTRSSPVPNGKASSFRARGQRQDDGYAAPPQLFDV